MILPVKLANSTYDVVIEKGALNNIGEYLDLKRKVLVITDDGVPSEYAQQVLSQCKEGLLCVLKQGENSKNFDNFKSLLSLMLDNSFARGDCVVAVGGGVVGDLAGFVASCYMRGVDFYNVPTTLLAQVDSSIGGKTAIDFEGVKNVVGTFYQPTKVVVDVDLLSTLDDRQLRAGLVEAIKMACTSDKTLFEFIENCSDIRGNLQIIVEKSLAIKKVVVEQDEKEGGLRKVLNFGHTIGHAIESASSGTLLHGECVALGMLPMCSIGVRVRLQELLEKCGFDVKYGYDLALLKSYLVHDKKASGDSVCTVRVSEIGSFEFENLSIEQILERVEKL